MSSPPTESMVDIHCHMLAELDDGAKSQEEALGMARMASSDGIGTVIVTPHQLGNFQHNTGSVIRRATRVLQQRLQQDGIPLKVLPGADVRIEECLPRKIETEEVLTLGDQHRHVLLELPHDLYFPLDPILKQLDSLGLVGILSHPERNRGLLVDRNLVRQLVDAGCLMQITAGSLIGSMGPLCRGFCRWMLEQGLVHFVATDAHGVAVRRPLLRRAYDEVARIVDRATAEALCVENPSRVAYGRDVARGRRSPRQRDWFRWRRAV